MELKCRKILSGPLNVHNTWTGLGSALSPAHGLISSQRKKKMHTGIRMSPLKTWICLRRILPAII
jgi:hypothetical protein